VQFGQRDADVVERAGNVRRVDERRPGDKRHQSDQIRAVTLFIVCNNVHRMLRFCDAFFLFDYLTYDHPNGFTYLQLGRDFINLFLFKYTWHFKTIHRTTFLSFWIFDFINKIEKFHLIHIQGR